MNNNKPKSNQTQRPAGRNDDDLRKAISGANGLTNNRINETNFSTDDQLKFDSFDNKQESISEEELILLAQEGSFEKDPKPKSGKNTLNADEVLPVQMRSISEENLAMQLDDHPDEQDVQ